MYYLNVKGKDYDERVFVYRNLDQMWVDIIDFYAWAGRTLQINIEVK